MKVELYDLTMTQAKEEIVKEIMKMCNVEKKMAEILFKNALIYNVVSNQIIEQVDFLYNAWRGNERVTEQSGS